MLKIFKSKLFHFHVNKWWGLAPLALNDEPPLLIYILNDPKEYNYSDIFTRLTP